MLSTLSFYTRKSLGWKLQKPWKETVPNSWWGFMSPRMCPPHPLFTSTCRLCCVKFPWYLKYLPVVQSLNCVQLFSASWTTACKAPLSSTVSWSLLKFISIELVMLSNHLTLCPPPSPFAFNLSQHQGLFQSVNTSCQVAKVLELQHQAFQWIFRVDFL